jgi:hypothetical protein
VLISTGRPSVGVLFFGLAWYIATRLLKKAKIRLDIYSTSLPRCHSVRCLPRLILKHCHPLLSPHHLSMEPVPLLRCTIGISKILPTIDCLCTPRQTVRRGQFSGPKPSKQCMSEPEFSKIASVDRLVGLRSRLYVFSRRPVSLLWTVVRLCVE